MAELGMALAEWALAKAKSKGATAAEVLLISARALSAGVRVGEVEKLKSSHERRLGLRVFWDRSSATSSTAELEEGALDDLIARTVALARLTAPDPWSGLPDPALHPRLLPELELEDREHGIIDAPRALALARRAEQAALQHDPRIRNSEGAEFDSSACRLLFANSQGFAGEYAATSYSLSVVPIAQDASGMQVGHWYTAARKFAKLDEPESVGAVAAKRALRRLGARRVKTTRAPVVFEPEMAAGLIRSLAEAASGPALYRGASYLVGKLKSRVASANVTIVDDGAMPAGLGSKPFDGEGLPTGRKSLVEQGVLSTYLLDAYSARRLNLKPTGNASRSAGQPPTAGAANLSLAPGPYAPEQIIATVKQGLYLTEAIGFGVNLVTGDYSRGASGLWIENGELAYPVQEITIAGNLREMFASIEMVGNDLAWRSSTAAPTLKVAELTIAGA